MKYKIWGTDSIHIFRDVSITDDKGYNGTKGKLTFESMYHHLGGPTLVGDSVKFINGGGDTLSVGPVRVQKSVQVSSQSNNVMEGDWCVGETVYQQYNDGSLNNWNNLLAGHVFSDSYELSKHAGAFSACPDTIPPLEDLSVPLLAEPASWGSAFLMTSNYANEEKYIHVPPDSVNHNAYDTYDMYITEFRAGGSTGKKLFVIMPPGGKLTRIFSRDGFLFDNSANDMKIQVVYVTEGTKFENGAWDLTNKNDFSYLSNTEYSGNLLFYTNQDIKWNYWINASFQGTWMTTGMMTVGGHFKLAGQLVANQLIFQADIHGDFKYMPFDPPWIDINPEARSWGTVYEGVPGAQPLSVVLNEAPITKVSFKYCFEFDGDQANNKDTDPDSSNAWASLDDMVLSGMPVCNGVVSTVYGEVEFPKGQTLPTQGISVTVANDLVEEWTEFFKIRVFDMDGAVLPNKKREGVFLIEIEDDDKAPKGKDTVFVGVEDADSPFSKFPATTGNGAVLDEYQIKIESLPMKDGNVVGTLTYDGAVVDADVIAAGLVISSEDIGKLVYHGEENAYGDDKASFTYRVISKDVSAVAANTVTINLQAVNDAPTVTADTIKIGEVDHEVKSGSIVGADIEGDALAYSFDNAFDETFTEANYNKITSFYEIDPATGVVSVKSDAVLNYESADSVLAIKVKVVDNAATTSGVGKDSAYAVVVLQIVDQNEAPVVRDTTFSVDENSKAGTEVGKLLATDPDVKSADFGVLKYSLVETDVPFAIDNQGVITVSEDDALDFETKSSWIIHVVVTDGYIPQTVTVTIGINDLNEPPHIEEPENEYNVVENTGNGVVFASIKVTDQDNDDGRTTLTAKLENLIESEGVTAEDLFEATVVEDTTDHSLRIVITVKDSAKLDYEALLANGENEVLFDVRLLLTDRGGAEGSLTDTAFTTIFVTDENEKPTAEDGDFTIAENSVAGTLVGKVVASDPDTANAAYGTLYYSFVETSTQFEIDATGTIRVLEGAVLDYETTLPDHKITLHVRVTDGVFADTATVTVTLTDENEPPVIIDDDKDNYDVPENTLATTEIARYEIMDVDAADANFATALKVVLSDMEENAISADNLFEAKIEQSDSKTYAVIRVKNSPDFEAILDANGDSVFFVALTLKDQNGVAGCNSVTLDKKITVLDVNEAPVIANRNFTPDENIENDEVVGEMTVDEPDTKNVEFRHLDFSIIEDVPFYMDSNKVKVGDASLLDFETTPEYTFRVVVKNCEKNASTGAYTDRCLADTADVKVTLQNVNEDPEIKCIVGDTKCNGPFEIAENSKTGTEIHAFAITDVDANDAGKLTVALTDSVPGGIAATLFDVKLNDAHSEVTIVVKDSSKLNYEAVDSVYVVVLTVKDVGGKTDTLIRTINVKDVNEKPTIADKSLDQPENLAKDAVVAELSATDPDTKHVADFGHLDYSIITENMPFYMDSNKVRVDDSTKIDFETTPVFSFNVKVENCEKNASTGKYTERCLADTATVTITLTNVNEVPEIKCIVGDTKCNGPFEIAENSKTGTEIHTFAITDVDANDAGKLTVALTDSVPGGTAATLFDVKLNDAHSEVTVVVKDSTKLNYEAVDSVYTVILTVKDAGGATDTLIRTINIKDVNEAPTIANKTAEQPENLAKDAVVTELSATDPDTKHVADFGHLDYAIITENMPFYMDSNKVRVGDSTKLDFETTPTFVFNVEVKNCEKNPSTGNYTEMCLVDTALVTINLKDVNETPKIVVDDDDDGDDDTDEDCIANCDTTGRGHDPVSKKTLTVGIDENSATNVVVFAYVVADEDVGDVGNLTPSLKDDNNTGVDSLFKVGLKTEGGKTKVVVYVKDGSKLDYEKVKLEHEVTVFITDPDGLQDSIVRIIKVQDVNEAPVVKDFTKTIAENLPNNSVVGELDATDPDVLNKAFSTLTYTILENDVPFYLDSNVIKVADSDRLNYEKDSVFTFHVKVSDGEKSATASVTIKLSNEGENPKIIVDDDDDGDDDSDDKCIANCDTTGRGVDPEGKKTLTVGVEENVPTGTVVVSYVVADEDFGEVTHLIPTLLDDKNSGADSLFSIALDTTGAKTKVVVTVKDSAKLDYETINPKHEVSIVVTDVNGLADTLKRVIEVIDINEPPTFESWPFEFKEHNEPGVVVGHVEHGEDVDTMAISGISKPENYIHDKFELTGGADGADTLFTLLPNGDLVANKTFNFETDPTEYTIYISLMDTLMPELVETDTIHITLLDVNEDPWIVTDSVVIEENVEKGTVIDTIEAKDLDLYDTVLTFTLVEDKSGCFDVSESGVVTVKTDNCKELDYEKNKELPIKVKVTDTKDASETKTIVVKITDVNEAPTIDDETITVSEDTPIGTPVDTVKATDPDDDPKYSELVYTVVGGDSSVFKVDSTTGVVTLIDSLDYEEKSEYTLVVEVFDGEFRDTATVTIKVGNVVESSEVEITRAETRDTVVINPDTLYVNTPDVCIEWKADGKLMGPDCDLELHEGENIIVRTFQDPTKDFPGVDTLVIYFSTATPVVTVSKASDANAKTNIFTIVEEAAAKDTTFYVNNPKNDILVTVTDTVTHTSESFTVKVELEAVDIPSNTFKKTLGGLVDASVTLNEHATGVTYTSVNGNSTAVTYTEKVNGKDVTVTYYTDSEGNIIENVDGIKTMTVTYTTEVEGREVRISYLADAVTGEVVQTTGGYTKQESGKDSKDGGKESGKGGKDNKDSKDGKSENPVVFTVTYDYVDANGNIMTVAYGVDAEGNLVKNEDGNLGYEVSYTYTNKYGNSATRSLFIVVDQVSPVVEIVAPVDGEVVYTNFVDVKWMVNGEVQDTLITQALEKGANAIVRFYRDKAGNQASDTIIVIMKNAKDVDIAVEQPVTVVTREKTEEYYASNEPEEGETFAVTIYNTKTDKEVETQVGGDFESKPGSGDEPYPGLAGHLGPTLGIDTKVPTVNAIGGLATLDDLVGKDGLVPLEGVDAANSVKITVDEYMDQYCDAEFAENVGSDISRANLFRTKMYVKIWIYTSLGQFVDYYSFTQDLDNPDYVNDAGLLTMYFEMKPDRDGNVRTESGRLYATGAYVYKTEVELKSTLRCSVPPFTETTRGSGKYEPDKASNKKGATRSVKEDLLKSFGYKRPDQK